MYTASRSLRDRLLSKNDCLRMKILSSTRLMSSAATSRNPSEKSTSTLRPFEEIPGPKGLPFIGNMLSLILDKRETLKPFEIQQEMSLQYGGIFRSDYGPKTAIVICKPKLVEELFRQEDKYPLRETPIAWKHHTEEMGYGVGLVSSGEEWLRARRMLNTKMLRPREIDSYVPKMNEVVTGFLKRIEDVKDENSVIFDPRVELFSWSLEMMGTVALGTRLGAVGENKGQESDDFVAAARETIRLMLTPEIMIYPEWLINFYKTKKLRELNSNMDTMIAFTNKRIEEKLHEIEKNLHSSDESGADMLTYLLGRKELSDKEVVASILALLFAAVDTTSNATQWALYCLASNPQVQERLYHELIEEVKPGHNPTAENINKLSYLKCCIKETQRMYPVSVDFVRVTTSEISLGGYKIPPNVWVRVATYFLGHDPENFQDPEKFEPERWMRGTGTKPAPFTLTQFGMGNRSCLGRRVADLEMMLLLARVCLQYKLEYIGEKPKVVTNPLLTSQEPIQLRFSKR